MTERELQELAAKAKALSDCLINVNSRAAAVEWCAEADSVLRVVARVFQRPSFPSSE